MTSAAPSTILFREGSDLDAVLAEVQAEHPHGVRVVDVTSERQGGVLGFFAHRRVAVRYTAEAGSDAAPITDHGPLAQLLEDAEMREDEMAREPRALPRTGHSGGHAEQVPNAEFARMLLEIAAAKSADRRSEAGSVAARRPSEQSGPVYSTFGPTVVRRAYQEPERSGVAPDETGEHARAPRRRPTPGPVPRATGAHRAADEQLDGAARYQIRRQLVEVGVPVHWVPEHTTQACVAVHQLAAQVPLAATPAVRPGELLVVAGPFDHAMRTARHVCALLHLDPESIMVAGSTGDTVPADRRVDQPWTAAAAAAAVRSTAAEPAVVVLVTDAPADTAAGGSWISRMVKSLAPDHLWSVVDAGVKPVDSRAALRRLGRADALVVVGAARTTSPASVWELDTPIALVDGRVASHGLWSALLMDRLADLGA